MVGAEERGNPHLVADKIIHGHSHMPCKSLPATEEDGETAFHCRDLLGPLGLACSMEPEAPARLPQRLQRGRGPAASSMATSAEKRRDAAEEGVLFHRLALWPREKRGSAVHTQQGWMREALLIF